MRRESKQGTLQGIQRLRGVAALLVVFYHSATNVERYGFGHGVILSFSGLKQLGGCGVDVFFVISGFIMMYVTQRDQAEPHVAGTFLLRRVVRIVPLYWLFTAFMVAVWLAMPAVFAHLQLTPSYIISSFALIPHFRPDIPGNISPLLDQGWTLEYEMYFYLLFAVLLQLRRQQIILPTLAAVFTLQLLCAHSFTGAPDHALTVFFGNPIVLEFLFGIALFHLYASGLYRRIPPFVYLVLALLGFLGSTLIAVPYLWRPLIWGIPAFLLVASGLSVSEIADSGLAARFMKKLHDASYSLYLGHALAILTLCKLASLSGLGARIPNDLLICVLTLAAIPIAFLTYRLIEKPITNYLNALQGTRQSLQRRPVG
jgi:exopolysaccharide production protein ExoZ